jgi:hypothetical protein
MLCHAELRRRFGDSCAPIFWVPWDQTALPPRAFLPDNTISHCGLLGNNVESSNIYNYKHIYYAHAVLRRQVACPLPLYGQSQSE